MNPPSAHHVLGLPYNATKEEVGSVARLTRPAFHSVFGRRLSMATSPQKTPVAQVKQAYRKLCLLHHPDLSPPEKRPEAERSFKLITEAYSELLSNKQSQRLAGYNGRAGTPLRAA